MSEVNSIVEENEELKKAVADVQESLKGYEKDYDELCSENEELKAELNQLRAEIANQEASEDTEEEEAEEEQEEEAEEEKKEAEEDSTDTQAVVLAKALRQLGLAQPVATKPKAVELSKEEVLAKFSQITDPKEKGEFYAQHRNQLFN